MNPDLPRPFSTRGATLARTSLVWLLVCAPCLVHGAGIGLAMGWLDDLRSPHPLARHDHPIYFHSAWITREFLRNSWTTAGYDPGFMAGYAKSVIFPASSTLPELVVALAGARDPIRVYKWYVFASAALTPWLVFAAALAWRLRPGAAGLAASGYLVYVWTDFPISYVGFGMLPYFLAVPMGLLVLPLICRYLGQGGFGWWLAAALGSSLMVLVHFTTAMVVVPSAILAYFVAWRTTDRFSKGRHLGVWLVPVVVLALNAFWWWPGILLASTKGDSGFAFVHSAESVAGRVWKILQVEPKAQAVLLGLALPGLAVLARRDQLASAALGGFLAAGFAWGYLAGGLPGLDFLQPGRHTYALYTGAALASGAGLAELVSRVRESGHWLAVWTVVALALVGVRLFQAELNASVRNQLALSGADPFRARLYGTGSFLSSQPGPHFNWLIDRVRRHVRPGERLLYEEGGIDNPRIRHPAPDPFEGGRYSGLLPYLTGVEVLGGPYLRSALTTNFTQFGGGELFGMADWDRDHFVRYARLYRPSAIVCWSPWARTFCRSHSDLIDVLDDDGALLIGRVKGFAGAAIEGTAEIEARASRLIVHGTSDDLDGPSVLRYHSVPCLRSRPSIPIDEVRLEGDPVPFLRLTPPREAVALELRFPFRLRRSTGAGRLRTSETPSVPHSGQSYSKEGARRAACP